ncbi:hypothetical protein KR222_001454 [Zaprionus bogoriensis]|nr:hypothetical protein KR222_001454 [Zaprionus bogoriensis]
MRLQLICLAIVGSLLLVQSELPPPSVYIMLGQDNFFEWLASIIWPGTTTPPPASPPAIVPASPTTSTSPITTTTTTTTISTPPFDVDRECVSCRCGLINTLRRIVGGQETRRHQYPWMAVVQLAGRFYCAGSLISDLYVLTAAHCVEGVPPELITLRFLEHNRSDSDAAVLERGATRVKTHELYNPRSFDNDIALIQLDRPLSFEGHMRPICLPVPSASFDGEVAIVTGWGALREGDLATDTLQEVEVLVLSQSECGATGYSPALITENMLCAGYPREGARDACTGDSGGPLHVLFDEQPGQYQLAGIVSWGEGCARPDKPGVYTRVNQYLRWIGANTPHACLCMPYPEEDY